MKKLIIFWISGILVISGCAQKRNEEKTLLGIGTQYLYYPEYLKGKVKEMHETNYWASEQDGKFIKDKPVTWKELDSIGSIKNVIEFFDEYGNLIEEDNIDENNILRNSLKVTYENGKSVRWEVLRADTVYQYIKPEYDPAGFFTGGTVYRYGTDTIVRSQVFSHDGKGNYTKFEYLDYKNNKLGTQELSLNEDGRVTEVRFKNKNDSLLQSFIQEYDDKGIMIVQKVLDGKSNVTSTWKTTALEYDEHGNWIQILFDVDNGKFKFIAERSFVYY